MAFLIRALRGTNRQKPRVRERSKRAGLWRGRASVEVRRIDRVHPSRQMFLLSSFQAHFALILNCRIEVRTVEGPDCCSKRNQSATADSIDPVLINQAERAANQQFCVIAQHRTEIRMDLKRPG